MILKLETTQHLLRILLKDLKLLNDLGINLVFRVALEANLVQFVIQAQVLQASQELGPLLFLRASIEDQVDEFEGGQAKLGILPQLRDR